MYLLKKGAFYKEKKYQVITDDDYFKGLMASDTHQDYGSLQVAVFNKIGALKGAGGLME